MVKKYIKYDLTTLTVILLSISLFIFSYHGLMLVVGSVLVTLSVSLFILYSSIKERMIYQYNLFWAAIIPISLISILVYVVTYIFEIESLYKPENMISSIMFFVCAWSISANLLVFISLGRKECFKDLVNNIYDVDNVPYEYCTTDVHSRFIFVKYHLTFEINHVVWDQMGYRIDIVRKYMNDNNLKWKEMKDEDFQLIEMLII
jgi:hypothetical protein